MGILDRLGLGRSTHDLLSSPQRLGIASPYAPAADLPPFVITDLLGTDADKLPLSRSQAIAIPAVSKARNLLISTIAKFPLVAFRGDQRLDVADQPTFLYRTNTAVTPYERMAWTIDDLIFYGYSLWLVERGTVGQILDAEWVPTKDWTITDGHILINEQEVPDNAVILFNSPFEGLLNVGARTIRAARDVENSWVGRARNPIPLIELHLNEETELENDEIYEQIVKPWAAARTSENGGIGFTPQAFEIRTHGEVKADLMVEGRNAVRTDVGSFLNIRASMLDGTMGIDSLTYSTTEGEKNSFYEFDLPFWTDTITARLSMDDVVPRGQRVAFDMYAAYHQPLDTGTPTED
ncbi:phage portal protein [Leifsonia aquatica]|uniref:phage portal protein n=1 Tax=Leifsonia aquatica TaxID=144185 RepID=UPI00381D85A6